ncbi:hypothetical protein V2G26_005705 [Clonostachys chloroleuca]
MFRASYIPRRLPCKWAEGVPVHLFGGQRGAREKLEKCLSAYPAFLAAEGAGLHISYESRILHHAMALLCLHIYPACDAAGWLAQRQK